MAKNSSAVQSKADEKRGRNWCVVLYPDDLPDDWLEKLQSLKVKIVLSPLHNQDFNADGTPKKSHHHVILMFTTKKSAAQIVGLLKSIYGEVNNSIQGIATVLVEQCIVHDIHAMVRYLAHVDNPDKFQYDVNDIRGYNGADVMELLKKSLQETQDTILAIQNFIVDNDITEFCDLADAVSFNRDWYLMVTTKSTLFFRTYIQSRRHKKLELERGVII